MGNEDKVERIKKTIMLLESLRDRLLVAGQGPPEDLFNRISELYGQLSEDKVERIKKTIMLLESLRDRLLVAGQGPPEDLFNRIDELYGQLLKELGHNPDKDKPSR